LLQSYRHLVIILPDKRQLTLSVGELARLVAEAGSTSSGPSFSLRGRIGSEAHRKFQEKRQKTISYQHEVHLDVCLSNPDQGSNEWQIRIRGRLDGLIEEIDRSVIEEIKTVAMSQKQFAAFSIESFPRHVRQLEIYLYLLSKKQEERKCAGRLLYINLPDGKQRAFEIPYNSEEVEPLIHNAVDNLIEREIRRQREAEQKKKLSEAIVFPFPYLRPGQSEISETVKECLEKRRDLLFEAPTGLGKTAAALFTALQFSLKNDKQVLFLTSRTTQQDLVFATAESINGGRDFPRVLLLRAKQKICLKEEMNCDPEECRYIDGFSQRLQGTRTLELLLKERIIHPDRTSEMGQRRMLCPYELQLQLCEDADLVIGDYNYAFDQTCRLTRLFEERDPSRLILIADEAHNLPERARSYYSARLDLADIQDAAQKLESEGWSSFNAVLSEIKSQFDYYLAAAPSSPDPYPVQLSQAAWEKMLNDFEAVVIPYWYKQTSSEAAADDDPVMSLYRNLEKLVRVLNYEGDNFAHLLYRTPSPALAVICLDASPFLREDFDAVHSAVCMSATLQPLDFSAQRLGLKSDAEQVTFDNPFPHENRRILIDSSVTTLYRQRAENVLPIASKIEQFYSHANRNVLAFFPSFDLMRRIILNLKVKPIFLQEEGMTDFQRKELLDKFRHSRNGLFCSVMGGVFAEGIDLPGAQAEAAVIVGIGLPQVCTENDLIRAYYDRMGDDGFQSAYMYPGMQRAIQSVGRVIRSEEDRGIILLMDSRFSKSAYQRLFPRHWYRETPNELLHPDWINAVDDFVTRLDSERKNAV